jgi:hypothetical protein
MKIISEEKLIKLEIEPELNLLSKYPIKARYKDRNPDPGVCTVISINWRDNGLSMSNGSCEYFPAFSEVEIINGEN